jgi:hypothetical protein
VNPEQQRQREAEAARRAYKPTEQENRDIRMVDEKFVLAKAARQHKHADWALNLAYWRGGKGHWSAWTEETQSLFDEVLGEDYPDWRERITENQIPQMCVQWVAKQNKFRHITVGLPNDPRDPEDVAAADRSTKTLRHLDRITGRNRKRRKAELLRAIYGTVFLHHYWDPKAKTTVALVDPQSGKVSGEEAYAGDVDWQPVTPWEVFPQPVPEIEQLQWAIKATVRTLDWIRETFPKRGPVVLADGKVDENMVGLADAHWAPDVTNREPSAIVMEYYEKPCKSYPKGRFLVVSNGILLHSENRLPHPKGAFPLVRVCGLPALEELWGKSIVEDMRGQQQMLNRVRSRVMENFNLMANPKGLAPREAHLDEHAFDSSPGEIIEYDATASGGAKPEYLEAPSIPVYVREMPEDLKNSMGQIVGINEISRNGDAPADVSSGVAISLLQEQDETRFALAADEMADSLTELDGALLGYVQALYTFPRQIRTMGQGKDPAEVFALMGTDLKGNTEVALDSTPGINDSIATKRQRYMDYASVGLLQLEGDFQTTAAVLQAMNENELADIVAEQAQRMAEMQQQQMQQEQAMLEQETAMGQDAAAQEQEAAQAQAEAQQLASEQQLAQKDAAHRQSLQQQQEAHALKLTQQQQQIILQAQAAKAKQAQAARSQGARK